MVAFTDDLQSLQSPGSHPLVGLFRSIKAKDGVYSVLENYDYSGYIHVDVVVKMANGCETISC